ncbi:hypothetical protein HMPREF9444_00685 [Succinatimonas hippei YIT 12066]|uniref:Uncharacterized protein n=1 Tax=Succinatimonas hippei (strain DSM 22608 / JCM 16073 / KCTC 15190 / YIT 12066) TaxID=762983 RepID=E8LJ12_SUCHY|nr:hypothetical protein HMPREF9444_00685 [Succinatimonas hippei YIT 12066]
MYNMCVFMRYPGAQGLRAVPRVSFGKSFLREFNLYKRISRQIGRRKVRCGDAALYFLGEFND